MTIERLTESSNIFGADDDELDNVIKELNAHTEGTDVHGMKDEDNMTSDSDEHTSSQQSLKAYVDALKTYVDGLAHVPTGVTLPYAGTSAPGGYLMCDGAAVSRTTYAALFAVIGVTHGQGDNSTTFNVPDYRGRFIRGVDHAQARDPDRATRTAMNTGGNTGDSVGSLQDGEIEEHKHISGMMYNVTTYPYGYTNLGTNYDSEGVADGQFPYSPYTSNTGGNETRPVNASAEIIIKT